MKIPDNTKIQSVSLRANNLARMTSFYSESLGFKVIEEKDKTVYLSANGKEPFLISLEENQNAKRREHTPGLYHTAIRLPDRKSLAEIFLHLFNKGQQFGGFSDHNVSEAIYLSDPEGNGIELYSDRPKEQWNWKIGQIEMETFELDLNSLVNEYHQNPTEWSGINHETDIGHIHLRVSSVKKAEDFYSNIMGLNVTNIGYPGAIFMSAGNYHHHIGANSWGKNSAPVLPDSQGLSYFTIYIPDNNYIEEIKTKLKSSEIPYTETKKGIIIEDFDRINVFIISN